MKKSAFTLIELLVVIAIIAILAAILFPVFAQAKVAAKKTQSISNVKQLGTSAQIYLADYDDLHPLGIVRSTAYGGWTWDSFVPVPIKAYTYGTSANDIDRLGANSAFVFNAMQPYMKNLQLYRSPGATFERAKLAFSMTPDANKGAGGVNLPTSGTGYFSYTYNGLLTGYSSTAIASVAELPIFWDGMGRRSIYGHMYASPNLLCGIAASDCRYVPGSAGCNGLARTNGETSFVSTNTNRSGWDVYSRGIVMTFADSHAKFRRLSLSNNSTVPTGPMTDPRNDPFTSYVDTRAYGRWYDQNFCHVYMFRPDYDFSAQPAVASQPDSVDAP
ncbi:MAG: prepilin-type N-terminal cleavage/methylation domain-containing protein [Fimbriimonadaceae bacterium]|nr:MAG: prepilin-type N-terminal cleavage/methylation domain-containing protein [Fimbriimonadaceae bacterium]